MDALARTRTLDDAHEPKDAHATRRVRAVDRLRGLVIVLMTLDHASGWFNAGRFFSDSARLWTPGSELPGAQFLLRFVTHLCAPTFVFLAGVSIAWSRQNRLARGESEASIDRALVARGLFIAALDPLWMAWAFTEGKGVLLQVLYAIGMGMVAMACLRRVPERRLAWAAIGFMVLSEAAAGFALWLGGKDEPTWLAALLVTGGSYPIELGSFRRFIFAYPLLPWLSLMALGHASARRLSTALARGSAERLALRFAGGCLGVFVLVCGIDGYGNMMLLRDDLSFLQWLHVSKYPPSLSYFALELGLMALAFWVLLRLSRHEARAHGIVGRAFGALGLLGQTALFFYVLHVHLLALLALAFGLAHAGDIAHSVGFAALTLFLLYFACVPYARYKRAHPDGLARYL